MSEITNGLEEKGERDRPVGVWVGGFWGGGGGVGGGWLLGGGLCSWKVGGKPPKRLNSARGGGKNWGQGARIFGGKDTVIKLWQINPNENEANGEATSNKFIKCTNMRGQGGREEKKLALTMGRVNSGSKNFLQALNEKAEVALRQVSEP